MSSFRRFSVFAALAGIGILLGLYWADRGAAGGSPRETKNDASPSAERSGTTSPDNGEPPRASGQSPSADAPARTFPPYAVDGELVYYFEDEESYRAYLDALRRAGLAALGRIDRLRAVRIGGDALNGPDPRKFGARREFALRVEQPPPPTDIAPEALARLRAFGRSAGSITGENFGGDGSGILVAVLDSGLEAHRVFNDRSPELLDLSEVGMAGEGAGHGTAVASIIGGSEGIAPNADLFAVRVLDEAGAGNSFVVAEGILEAVDAGARVINLSMGVYQDSRVLREAVRYARSNEVLVVASAGNDAQDRLPYPAAYGDVLSVTAVDAGGGHALFPNRSERIDFAAPGVGISAARGENGSELFSGTSAAAPFVSGTLASLLSEETGRSADEAVELMRRHLNEAGAPGPDPLFGEGVVDWERLRTRNEADVRDLALADIHLRTAAAPGTTEPLQVIVQNQGNERISGGDLEVAVGNGEPVSFSFGALNPGESATRKVYTQIPGAASDRPLDVAARVTADGEVPDSRPDNNVKAKRFQAP